MQNGVGQTLAAARQYVVQSVVQKVFLVQSSSGTQLLGMELGLLLLAEGAGVGAVAGAGAVAPDRLQYGVGHVLRRDWQ